MGDDTHDTAKPNILSRITAKSRGTIRFILFNINGVKTLRHYAPWNQFNNDFNKILHAMSGDVISLQELKMTNGNILSINLCDLGDYRSFISVPAAKKGYSGVGLFVRIPRDDEDSSLKHNLNVIKAEEGITGYLRIGNRRYVDLDEHEAIGGYVTAEDIDEFDENKMLELDKEGRAVAVELACGLVVFSVYCPANSMGTEEGEVFKNFFTELLVRRCQKLRKLGKQVLILGDMNISLNLIDQADGIQERINKGLVKYFPDGEVFETQNLEQCLKFKQERFSRLYMSRFVNDSIVHPDNDLSQVFLHDTTREFQGRKLGIYTCWNTMNGARQTNYGSRIDLILTTKKWMDSVTHASHWPFLMGSDHCPIFTDFAVHATETFDVKSIKLPFEAKRFYKIVKHHDIASMFKASRKRLSTPEDAGEPSQKKSFTYVSRKDKKPDQISIKSFFQPLAKQTQNIPEASDTKVVKSNGKKLDLLTFYGEPPKCQHGESCQLKTSLKSQATRGKKFWCCPRNSVGMNNEGRCSYFQWVEKK